jgi:hypothetical protein
MQLGSTVSSESVHLTTNSNVRVVLAVALLVADRSRSSLDIDPSGSGDKSMLSTQPVTPLFREGGLSGTAGVRGVGGG